MNNTNPIPTQQETLERETVCGNCGGNLYQRPDPNNVHWYHASTCDVRCPTRFALPTRRAAVAGPRGDFGERAKQLVDRWVIDRHLFPQQKSITMHDIRILTEWIAGALDHAAATSSPAPAKSLLRDPVQVRVLPTPIVTREGVPCEDQVAALEEFKERCRAAVITQEEQPLTPLQAEMMERDTDMARDHTAPAERTEVEGEQEVPNFYIRSRNRVETDDARTERLTAQLEGVMNSLATSQQEVERLRAGNFTPEEFQNLCHNFDESDKETFVAGCLEYQRKLFGTTPISDSARRAAEEIYQWFDPELPVDSFGAQPSLEKIAAIISKHFAAAPADNDAESSLLSKIVTIADIGSAEEFGDALERLKSIRKLISTTTKGDC